MSQSEGLRCPVQKLFTFTTSIVVVYTFLRHLRVHKDFQERNKYLEEEIENVNTTH
jgi:hypothetical protein